jgi:very-short-patch-repair endonuclease
MDSDKKSNYNKDFKPLARKLRKDSTKGEIILWTEVLSKRKMLGLQFIRQYAIDKYIADFACRKIRLIIEIDGYAHNDKYDEDLKRDERLKELGYKTIRFEEQEIYHDINNVIRSIEFAIEELLTQSPYPLLQGGLEP